MKIDVFDDAATVARQAARHVAATAREVVRARGRFTFAVSGGSTPWEMLRALAGEDVPWEAVDLFQIDERVAPAGHPDRNLTHLRDSLGEPALARVTLHPMPVESRDLTAAAGDYARALEEAAGAPAVLDLAHLGLGPDGHTASLVPGDTVLDVHDRDVAITGGEYQGRRRMTLTYPILNRARQVLWLVTGGSKVSMLARLRDADPSIPGGRVAQAHARIMADRDALGGAAA